MSNEELNTSSLNMPISIKYTLMLLFFAVIAFTVGTYFDMELFIGEDIFSLYVMNFVWFGIVCWVAWLLASKRKDIRYIIIVLSILTISINISDYTEYGVTNGLYAYILESIIYLMVLILLNTSTAKGWYRPKN